jgi:hypothetical protein
MAVDSMLPCQEWKVFLGLRPQCKQNNLPGKGNDPFFHLLLAKFICHILGSKKFWVLTYTYKH